MRQDPYKLRQMLEPAIEAMGYELVGVEFQPHGVNALLRVYIDEETGIDIDDCQRVSHQISGILDVADPISGQYTLEVSSPGLDRLLFKGTHFSRFAGSRVRMMLNTPLHGRSKLVGLIHGMRGDSVAIEVDGTELLVPLECIEKARLIPDYIAGIVGRQST